MKNGNKKNNSELENKPDIVNNDIDSNINLDESSIIYIEEDEKGNSNELKLVGLYDPDENDLILICGNFLMEKK